MRDLDKQSWAQLSPLLDRALDLDGPARAAFLADLRADRPALAGKLAALLEAHQQACQGDFLAQGPSLATLPAPSLSGLTIGAYQLDRQLGMGGMGSVWLAHRNDGRFTGQVAVKLVNLAVLDDRARDRFAREATILARLAHPQIARLLDAGVTPVGQPYLVLEYVEGERIDRYADAHRLDVPARLALFLQVADAVSHAHANLVVHRDLKPSNILVDTGGRVKLLDFGIARLLDDDPARSGAGPVSATITLTPGYAAPEQARAGVATTATDVYALGVLLFELLSGGHPTARGATTAAEFLAAADRDADRLTHVLRAVAADPARAGDVATARGTSIERLRRACAGDLEHILNTALARAAADRYDSVAAFAADVRRHLQHEPVSAQPDSLWYRATKLARRRRVETAAAAAVLLAIVAGAGVAVWQAGVAARERDFAVAQLQRSQAINDLNEFLLADAAPGGRPFTAGDVLARAQAIAEQEHANTPEVHVATLVMLGRQYSALDLDDRAVAVLARAYDRSRALPPSPARGVVACEYADVLAGRDDARAQALLRAGLDEAGSDPHFVLERVACEVRASQMGRRSARPGEGLVHAQAAQALLDTTGVGSPLARLHVATNLASSYFAAGQEAAADAAFTRAWALLTALGREHTTAAGTLLNNWALAVHGAGRPLDAEPLYQRAIAIARDAGEGLGVSPTLLTNLGRAHLDLRRLPEAVGTIEQALAAADARGDVTGANQARILLAAALREAGDLERAAAVVTDYARRVETTMPPAHPARSYLALVRGNIALSRGDLAAAAPDLDAAVTLNEAGGAARQAPLARALTARSLFALADHRPAAAAADAARAVAIFSGLLAPGQRSSQQGRAYLALGRARAALDDAGQARTALTEAVAHLTPAVGAGHPDTVQARALLDARPDPPGLRTGSPRQDTGRR